MIANGDFTNINAMPFRDITLPLFNMHPSSIVPGRTSSSEDCTHYCYFPQMWQTMWYHLYEGAFGKQAELDYTLGMASEHVFF